MELEERLGTEETEEIGVKLIKDKAFFPILFILKKRIPFHEKLIIKTNLFSHGLNNIGDMFSLDYSEHIDDLKGFKIVIFYKEEFIHSQEISSNKIEIDLLDIAELEKLFESLVGSEGELKLNVFMVGPKGGYCLNKDGDYLKEEITIIPFNKNLIKFKLEPNESEKKIKDWNKLSKSIDINSHFENLPMNVNFKIKSTFQIKFINDNNKNLINEIPDFWSLEIETNTKEKRKVKLNEEFTIETHELINRIKKKIKFLTKIDEKLIKIKIKYTPKLTNKEIFNPTKMILFLKSQFYFKDKELQESTSTMKYEIKVEDIVDEAIKKEREAFELIKKFEDKCNEERSKIIEINKLLKVFESVVSEKYQDFKGNEINTFPRNDYIINQSNYIHKLVKKLDNKMYNKNEYFKKIKDKFKEIRFKIKRFESIEEELNRIENIYVRGIENFEEKINDSIKFLINESKIIEKKGDDEKDILFTNKINQINEEIGKISKIISEIESYLTRFIGALEKMKIELINIGQRTEQLKERFKEKNSST